MIRLLCALLLLVSPLSWAGTMRILAVGSSGVGIQATTTDASCASAISLFASWSGGGTASAVCTADPVTLGTLVVNNTFFGVVVSLSGYSTPTNPSLGGFNYQPQIDALNSALSAQVSKEASDFSGLNSQVQTNTTAVGNVNSILNQPFDLPTALAGTAFFFTTTLFFYGIGAACGAILEKIRRPTGHG